MDSNEFFERLLVRHGDSPLALDWSPEGQRERFRVLTEIGIRGRESVLDVGCGLGHFRDYLRGLRQGDDYTGIDSCRAMMALAFKRSFSLGMFVAMDALCDEPLPVADWVVSSGMLNIEDGSNEDNMRALLRRCYAACRKGAAVNMLSACTGMRRSDRHYYDPMVMLSAAFTITPRVTLRHDYRDNDFTLYLYRERP